MLCENSVKIPYIPDKSWLNDETIAGRILSIWADEPSDREQEAVMYPYQQFQPMQPYQPYQQSFDQHPSIPGRVVQSPNDIMPGDVPMNGTPCFFPMGDGSAVLMKVWNPDGTIGTIRFLPEEAAPKEPTQLDRIESMLSKFIGKQEGGNDEQHS